MNPPQQDVDDGQPTVPTWNTHAVAVSGSTKGLRRAMAAEQRFMRLADVAEVLDISTSQVYALVRSNELRAIKIGGRGQWRVERAELEDYIKRMYQETSDFIAKHPFIGADETGTEGSGS